MHRLRPAAKRRIGSSWVTREDQPADAAGSARISPTAHYTAYVWVRNGLAPERLATPLGRALHLALLPANLAWEHLGSEPTLDQMLLARHRAIDWLLERQIRTGRVGQVLEVAAGLSARGLRLTSRFPGLRYVEADLADMAAHKRRLLEELGIRDDRHQVVGVDALAEGGPASVPDVAARALAPGIGTAVVTEGLLGYFELAAVQGLWRRVATLLAGYPAGVYLSDLTPGGSLRGMRGALAFRWVLSAFVRGATHLHFTGDEDAVAALRAAGFARAHLHRMDDAELAAVDVPGRERGHVVRVLEAWASPA